MINTITITTTATETAGKTSTTATTTSTRTKISHYLKMWTIVPYLQYLIQSGAVRVQNLVQHGFRISIKPQKVRNFILKCII